MEGTHGLKPFFVALYVHVFASYRSTLLGLLVSGALYGLTLAQASPNHYLQLVAGVVILPFIAWKDHAVAAGEIKMLGFARLGLVLALFVVALSGAIGCAFIKSQFGPTFAADELNCETSEIGPLRDALVPQAEAAITKAIGSAVSGDVGAAVSTGLAFLEAAVKTALGDQWAAVLCAEQVAVNDYEKAHPDAGPAMPATGSGMISGLTFRADPPDYIAYAAVKAHLAAQPKHPKAQ